jgi:hypothetical protein
MPNHEGSSQTTEELLALETRLMAQEKNWHYCKARHDEVLNGRQLVLKKPD